MRLAGGDILSVKLPVDVDRGVDRFHDGVRTRREASAPHPVAAGRLAWSFAFLVAFTGHCSDKPAMNEIADANRSHARKRLAVILVGGIAGVAVGLAGVYGIK